MTHAHAERIALVETMIETGPDAPTLCGEWSVRDLAAHLVIRERRLDAAPGIFLSPLAGWTQSVQDREAALPWPDLVDKVRTGPPAWSPYKVLDPVINLGEFFVHHEDVRRGGPTWEPRQLTADLQDALWSLVRVVGKLGYRSSPVTVVAKTPDGRSTTFRGDKPSSVTLHAEPSELLLHAFGRDAVAIDFDGDSADIDVVKGLDRGF